MKKKLALLMAAIMTVAMVPMTAFAAATTDINAVDQVKTAVDATFTSRVELSKDEDSADLEVEGGGNRFQVYLTLENGKFAKAENPADGDDYYIMDTTDGVGNYVAEYRAHGVADVEVLSDTRAKLTLSVTAFNGGADGKDLIILPIVATADEVGEVIAKFSTNNTVFADVKEVIATAYEEGVLVESDGVVTFVEDSSDDRKNIKDITIEGLTNGAINNGVDITLKLKGNYRFVVDEGNGLCNEDGVAVPIDQIVTLLNDNGNINCTINDFDEDELTFRFTSISGTQVPLIRIGGIAIEPTKSCDVGDVATITVSSKDFDSVKLEVARMVESGLEKITVTMTQKVMLG